MNLNFLAMSCRNYLTQGHIISFLCYIDPSKPNIFHKFVLTKNRFFANSHEEKLFFFYFLRMFSHVLYSSANSLPQQLDVYPPVVLTDVAQERLGQVQL